MRLSMPCLAAALLLSSADAQMIDAPRLPTPEVLRAAKVVSEYAYLGLSPVYEVRGNQLFEDLVLVADRIVFQPGSRLVLGTGRSGDRVERYIAARRIEVVPGGTRPVITWLHDAQPPAPPNLNIKAAVGLPGGVAGGAGGPGVDGATGFPGIPGRSAPTLYLFTSRVVGGPIEIDLRGQDGGAGGTGQDGGDGSPGSPGRRSEATPVGCSSPAGDGGRGGDAGRGGNGGPGGRGGTGGTFILVSTSDGAAQAQTFLTIRNEGGKGGPAGKGGQKGIPGPGGEPGRADSGCDLGKRGEPGAEHEGGLEGEPGADGPRGAFAVTTMTAQQFSRTLGSR